MSSELNENKKKSGGSSSSNSSSNTSKQKGRRAFKPTPEDRQKIFDLYAMGTPQEEIASLYKVNVKTLRKHCPEELTRGAVEANYNVARTLYDMATSGQHVAATIFWCKTRNRMRTSTTSVPTQAAPAPELVVVNNDGGPLTRD